MQARESRKGSAKPDQWSNQTGGRSRAGFDSRGYCRAPSRVGDPFCCSFSTLVKPADSQPSTQLPRYGELTNRLTSSSSLAHFLQLYRTRHTPIQEQQDYQKASLPLVASPSTCTCQTFAILWQSCAPSTDRHPRNNSGLATLDCPSVRPDSLLASLELPPNVTATTKNKSTISQQLLNQQTIQYETSFITKNTLHAI